MLTLHHRVPEADGPFDDELVLPFERRQHSRLLVRLVSGREAALTLERGSVLRDGDLLVGRGDRGKPVRVRVVAAAEPVYDVRGEALARAAYHLGNRHVPLQIGENRLRLVRDPVLRTMLEGLGFLVEEQEGPFEPEAGAYGQGALGGHHHSHARHGRSPHLGHDHR